MSISFPRAARILLVEDEARIAEMVRINLEAEGFAVTVAPDGPSGLAIQQETPVDLVVLDLVLPGMHGLELLRTLRRRRDPVPVIILTAHHASEDRIQGLSAGADDYIGKPFSVLELVARIRAILRRSERGLSEARTLRSGPFSINLVHFAVHAGRRDLQLSLREFRLLEALATHPGRVLGRGELVNLAWDHDAQPTPRTVDVHIAALRRKLGEATGQAVIQTVEREGYRWVLPVSESNC